MIKPQPKQDIVFPGKTAEDIQSLIKKYNLQDLQIEKLKELSQAKSQEKKEIIFEEIPTRKIARTVKEVAEGKISAADFVLQLQKRLNIPKEKAKSLAQDLEVKVLAFAKRVAVEESSPTKQLKISKKPLTSFTEKPKEKSPKTPPKKDSYRELIK